MDHLTPDELAAWMDGALSATERSAAEAHASDCARCQAMLAAIVRTVPDVRRTPSWIGSVRWLVPIAAAALAIAVWVGVTRESAAPQLARTDTAPAPAPEREAKPSSIPQLPAEPKATIAEALPAPPPARDTKEELSKRAAAKKDRDKAAPPFGGIAASKTTVDRIEALEQNRAPAAATPPPPAPAAPPPPPVSAAGQAGGTPAPAVAPAVPPEPQPAKPQSLNEAVTVTSEAPQVGRRSTVPAQTTRMPPVEVVSPERSYRWRAVTPGSIQHSVDGGLSWRSSATGTSVPLRAGSAPSRTVCWLVGQGGLVLLTTDGQNWQVRAFPEQVDLTDVSAIDARNATVTTANRRRFATADGGATWSPLQEN